MTGKYHQLQRMQLTCLWKLCSKHTTTDRQEMLMLQPAFRNSAT